MYSEPVRSDYPDYASYSLAAVGYCLLTGGGKHPVPVVDRDSCVRINCRLEYGTAEAVVGGCSTGSSGGTGCDASGVGGGDTVGSGGSSIARVLGSAACGRDGVDPGASAGGQEKPGCGASAGGAGVSGSWVRNGVSGTGASHVRGKNWERNRLWKAEKQKKKKQKKERVEDRSFFAGLDDSVRDDLRKSRAEALIAKNRREAAVDEAKLRDMAGARGVLADVLRVVRSTEELQRKSKSAGIRGWAKTLADSVQKSVAESASSVDSSLPTLSEVGWGESGLRSTGGAEKSERQLEYEIRSRLLDEYYDGALCWSSEDKAEDYADLQAEFADLSMDPVEADRFRVRRKFGELVECLAIDDASKEMLENFFKSV